MVFSHNIQLLPERVLAQGETLKELCQNWRRELQFPLPRLVIYFFGKKKNNTKTCHGFIFGGIEHSLLMILPGHSLLNFVQEASGRSNSRLPRWPFQQSEHKTNCRRQCLGTVWKTSVAFGHFSF